MTLALDILSKETGIEWQKLEFKKDVEIVRPDEALRAMIKYLDYFKESNYYAKELSSIKKTREEEKEGLDNLMQFVHEHIIKDKPERFIGRKMDEVIIEYCKSLKT